VLRDAGIIAGKDLRTEWRTRVGLYQVLPFALMTLVLFGLALDPDRGVLDDVTPGLFWVAVLFASVLAVQRSWSVESTEGARDNLVLSGLAPGGIFLGKAAALAAQLLVLELVLVVGVAVFYGADLRGGLLLVATIVPATAGIAAVGSLYGVLAVGLRVRETLLPLLVLPVLAPVLIGATRAFEAALGDVPADGWPWAGLLALFALGYLAFGTAAFGSLLEDS
jgi:heme exporter protein B